MIRARVLLLLRGVKSFFLLQFLVSPDHWPATGSKVGIFNWNEVDFVKPEFELFKIFDMNLLLIQYGCMIKINPHD
jgi:hypothetical protein